MNSVDPIISAVVAVRRTGASPDAAPAPSAPAPTPPASTESGLRFELDTATRKVVVRVTDPSTGEVLRQIPSEVMLKIAEALADPRGGTLDASA